MNKLDKLTNALQDKVVTYLDTLNHDDVARLGIYLGSEVFNGVEPNEVQKAFIDKFIGQRQFDKFIEEFVTTHPIFVSSKPTRSLIVELTGYVTYYATRKLLQSEKQHQHQQSLERLLNAKVNAVLARAILAKSIEIHNENKVIKAADVLAELVEGLHDLGFGDENLKELCLNSIKSFK